MNAIRIAIVLSVLSLIISFAAMFLAQLSYSSQPHYIVVSGPARTHQGETNVQSVDIPMLTTFSYEDATTQEHKTSFVTQLGQAISSVVAAMLPNTSAPHGANTCTMVSDGKAFTVTTDQPCSNL